MSRTAPPEPYLSRLQTDLATIKTHLDELLDMSTIRYVNPNRPGGDVWFVTASDWGWGSSDEATSAAQMALLGRYSAWFDRFTLLFPHPTSEISSRINETDEFIRRWINRNEAFDHSIPRAPDIGRSFMQCPGVL